MRRPSNLARRALATAAAVVAATAAAVTPVDAAPEPSEQALPIVFVHGASGSGAQYETQALRWASNGYPKPVRAIDRISTTPAVIYPILDAFIDDLLAETGDDQVYVLGHSAGTFVMAGYLASSPERAARVAKYVGIDGLSLAECPGGVPCMGLWARGNPARALGSTNVHLPEHGHTDVVTSPEGFAAQYEFLTGKVPATTLVLPEPPGQVDIAGRALNFPANTGIDGATVQLWKVDPATGQRSGDEPVTQVVVDSSGNFGPWKVNGQQRYELTVVRTGPTGEQFQQHFYYEPWIRDNHLIRLNLSPIGSPLSTAIERGPHSTVSVVRQREWWGNNTVDATNVDHLLVSTSATSASQPPLDIINAATAPYAASTIAVIGFDIDVDQTSDVSALQPLGAFLSGVDIYMPATVPTDGTVTFDHQQRRTSAPQVINTPNWSSEAGHGMTVTFREWVQGIDSWGTCRSAKPSPCK
jgi:pimeloyl-ACP methyl ester carboxylesterase